MQSFKVACALTASAVSAASNGAVSVNKAIIQRQPFIRCVQKKNNTCHKDKSFSYDVRHLVWQNIKELGFLAFQMYVFMVGFHAERVRYVHTVEYDQCGAVTGDPSQPGRVMVLGDAAWARRRLTGNGGARTVLRITG